MRTLRFRVTGRVQGVGFRWWTRQQAGALELSGSVRNLADGSVEVRACGTGEGLDQLKEKLQLGPPGARVRRVETFDWRPDTPPRDFRIVR